jgi:protein-tyrosine phosphatase
MIDLHCHILPGLDDGAPSLGVSLEMAAMAADSGVTHIFATPHCNTRNERKNYRSAALIGAYSALQRAIDAAGIPVTILSGAEVLARGDLEAHLAAEDFMTLNGSRYLLVEFYFEETAAYIENSLRLVEQAGLVPVVAHPERYYCVQRSPELAEIWRQKGRVLQLNKGSLLGDLGERAYDTAALLLRREAVAAIASDAHHVRYRNPHMGPLLQCLEQRFPNADPVLLLRETPLRIAKDLSL